MRKALGLDERVSSRPDKEAVQGITAPDLGQRETETLAIDAEKQRLYEVRQTSAESGGNFKMVVASPDGQIRTVDFHLGATF